jgi:hypothetical protein
MGVMTAASQPDDISAQAGKARYDAGRMGVRIEESFGRTPLGFEENKGQMEKRFSYVARGDMYSMMVNRSEAEFLIRRPNGGSEGGVSDSSGFPKSAGPAFDSLRLTLVRANPSARVSGIDLLPGKSDYFFGPDPSGWFTNIGSFRAVKVESVYSGIDLLYYGNRSEIEFDWTVSPGSDPKSIRLSVSGRERPAIDNEGNVMLSRKLALRLRKPQIYQEHDGVRIKVAGGYVVDAEGNIGFWLGAYDRALPLVIDPVILYSRLLGSAADDRGQSVAVDAMGNVYVTGQTVTSNGGVDVFVSKLNAAGTSIIYSAVLSGGAEDQVRALEVDQDGSACVGGYTSSSGFATSNALQTTLKGTSDAFVAKLNPAGDGLIFSTYLGGSGSDQAYSIALDRSGSIFVSGNTSSSSDFPLVGAFQPKHGGGGVDGYVAKLNSTGTALIYSSYLGGSGDENCRSIAVDPAGNAYVTGRTTSTDFPVMRPLQGTFGGNYDAFVTKISPTGNSMVYSTYLGGSGQEVGHSIFGDAAGNVYLTGKTSSPNFPLVNPLQPNYGGGSFDGFVAELDYSGTALIYSSYLGGSDNEECLGLALDAFGNAYVTGFTASRNFPVVNAFQASFGGGSNDVFVASVNPSGNALVYSSYLGGSGNDEPYGIEIDSTGNLYVVGWTASTDFPGSMSAYLGGTYDAFVSKIETNITSIFFPQLVIGGGYSGFFSITNTGATSAAGRLSFLDRDGNPMVIRGTQLIAGGNKSGSAATFNFDLPPGGSAFFIAGATDSNASSKVGWVRFDAAGGSVTASEMFENANAAGIQELVGVLPSQPLTYATIAVDDDESQGKQIGYAIANPGSQDLSVRVAVLDENGNVLDDKIVIPLRPGQQIAEFLWEKDAAYKTFRGSMVLRTDPGTSFAAVAVEMKQSCFAVIPVIPQKSPKVPN